MDLSPYLYHFTSLDKLTSILHEQIIHSSVGYQCFTDAPLIMMLETLDYMNSTVKPILHSYGIGFLRDTLIKDFGARPVIYGDNKELKMLSPELKWRGQLLDASKYDFSWLREWRVKGELSFSKIDRNEIILIAPTVDDLNNLRRYYKINDVIDDDCKIVTDDDIEVYQRFRGISLDRLKMVMVRVLLNDYKLKEYIDRQKLGFIGTAYSLQKQNTQ